MNKKTEWFENEDFWFHYAPIMFDGQRWAEAAELADRIYTIAGLSAGKTLLDAGCGPGRISLALAQRGLIVTGVDLMQSFLDAAAESAADEGLSLDLIKADLRYYRPSKPFDAAVNLYTSFGYCDSIEDDFLILRNIASSLKQGAYFIMECLSREIAVRSFIEGEWFERDEKTVLTEFKVVNAWEGLRSRWILIDNKTGKRREHEFVQRLYSAPELKRILLSCGFAQCSIYGDFDLSAYDEKAHTMVLVCTK